MESQTIGYFAFKSNQQGLEYVNPGEGAFTDKAMFVHLTVEMTLPSAFDGLSVALVFSNVGKNAAVPQHLPRFTRVKATISIETCAGIVECTPLHVLEQLRDRCFQVVAIMMMACNRPCRRNNVSLLVRYWQNIAGLGFLPALIGYVLAPFLAALWLPSRLIADKFNSPLMVMTLASNSFCKLPSLLHLRK